MNQAIIGILEQQRRDALVAWYLGQLIPKSETLTRVLNEDDLYEYLLIDNQVTAEVDTSRVAQGIASVQQHIHAIYNGMEPGFGGVTLADRGLWRDGMSRYDQWAGYQMLADYPENYLDPALRVDKTRLFEGFESELGQARLSKDTVQAALGNYLQGFEVVSNLQITGCYVDSAHFVNADYYFIGRQTTEPFAFYWRKAHLYKGEGAADAQMAGWTEWKLVDSVSGAQVKHCRPVVMQGRLYVVWAESGKPLINATGGAITGYEFSLKLCCQQLNGSWGPAILLNTGQAPDALLPNVMNKDSPYKIDKGYQLAVTSDNGHNYVLPRLVIGFWSQGFASEDLAVNVIEGRDEHLNPLGMGSKNNKEALLFMVGEDTRRAQYRIDHLFADADKRWKISSVVWDRESAATLPGTGESALNEHLELRAEWQAGRVMLQGVCNKIVRAEKSKASHIEFKYSKCVDQHLHGFSTEIYAANGYAQFVAVQWFHKRSPLRPVYVKLYHAGREVCNIKGDKFELFDEDDNYLYYVGSLGTGRTPEAFAITGQDGGFSMFVSMHQAQGWRLDDPGNYYRITNNAAEMPWSICHYGEECYGKQTTKVVLNGAARTPVYYREWKKGKNDPSDTVSIFQWGDTSAVFGTNGFKVTREALAEPAPLIATAGGAQYLDLSDAAVCAGNVKVRLNTLFAKDLVRKASLSLENALSWETQHTAEPLLPGQTTPQYVDFTGANGLYFWELFFHAPHLVAGRLQQEFDYSGAQAWLEYVFNPQLRVAPLFPPPSTTDWLPHWSCRPLGLADNPALELEGLTNPDAIARGAPSHYRKAIFTLYLNNLIAWGDMLYRQVTRDSLTEAQLLYVRALSLLGPLSKGRSISRWEPISLADAAAEESDAFADLESSWGESLSPLIPVFGNDQPWLRLLDQSVFRLPVNTQLLDLWDRLDLRLHNLRNNLTLDGRPMALALYEIPANPQDLLRAQLAGSNTSVRRLGAQAIIPPYRFSAMLPRARNAVDTLIRFGDQVRQAMESRDRAEQDRLQQSHVLELSAFVERLEVLAVEQAQLSLKLVSASREQLQAQAETYDKWISRDVSDAEQRAEQLFAAASASRVMAAAGRAVGHALGMLPNTITFLPMVPPIPIPGGWSWGGPVWSAASLLEGAGTYLLDSAEAHLRTDARNRRRQEWALQKDQVLKQLDSLARQAEQHEVTIQSAQLKRERSSKALEQAQAMYGFIQNRATNSALHQWLLGQMSTLYFQAYDAVLSLCLATEACWQYEIGDPQTAFIPANAWVDNRHGLTAGESLSLGLLQMESAFLVRNERRLELVKTVSLRRLLKDYCAETGEAGWAAIIASLRETGGIEFELKPSLFDRDYPGHYLRQLMQVSLSLPGVLSPYENARATLSQLTSSYLLKPDLSGSKYMYQQAQELPDEHDDINPRFVIANQRGGQQVAISGDLQDTGGSQFGEERYQSFEGTGAVSRWALSFPRPGSARQQALFDDLQDVIVHVRYRAVDGGKPFAEQIKALLTADNAPAERPVRALLMQPPQQSKARTLPSA